jgi:hypothetical protein
MPTSRLKNDSILFDEKRKSFFGKPDHIEKIRSGLKNGSIRINETLILGEGQRLDMIAGQKYGDARYWWILAIASNIGYGLQLPPGTVVIVPNIADILLTI